MAKMIFASRYIYNTLPEYEGCRQCFTIGSASEFNTQALERNLDMSAVKENYVDCLANRLRKERLGEHGLFTDAARLFTIWRRIYPDFQHRNMHNARIRKEAVLRWAMVPAGMGA